MIKLLIILLPSTKVKKGKSLKKQKGKRKDKTLLQPRFDLENYESPKILQCDRQSKSPL